MLEFDPNTLAGRIERRIQALNTNPTAASVAATGKQDAIRKIYEKARKREQFSPRIATLQGLARALKTSVAYLVDGEGPEHLDGNTVLSAARIPHDGRMLPYAGKVQAGAFVATDDYFNQDIEEVPNHVKPDPAFAKVRQYAWRSYGDSMNEAGILDGMWVVGADASDYVDTYGDIKTEDLVVVERTKHQGAERELTVKQIHYFRDRYELRPVSSNPDHDPIVVKHNHDVDGDGLEVRVIGVVLTAYANLRNRR